MQKIKLPLRITEAPLPDKKVYFIQDSTGLYVCGFFTDQQTAQLFADCFEQIASEGWTDPDPALCRTDYVIYDVSRELCKRAAEAVKE